ncbi:MAG: hypothetical protein J7502_09775 [Flavisolibacter sp.]|nr:hypothetical protein [Flavisolibacter sp.]
MRTYFHFIILTLIVASCQGNPNTKKVERDSIDRGAHSNSIVTVKTSDTLNTENFSEFWKIFRNSVLSSDTSQIVAMTEFPFQTRGPFDSDPTVEYNKRQFLTVFRAFLNQWNGMDLEGTTELESIKTTVTPDETDIVNDYARIGGLVFNKTKKGWKLVFAYLNNETIDLLDQ